MQGLEKAIADRLFNKYKNDIQEYILERGYDYDEMVDSLHITNTSADRISFYDAIDDIAVMLGLCVLKLNIAFQDCVDGHIETMREDELL